MENTLKSNLYKLFKKDARLWDKDNKELNETLLKDLIDKLDEKLLELLLSDEESRKKFFIKIKDVFVLKQNDLKFFIDENRLDNSYTQYQNKIGLRIGNKLLSERDEVVLDWPFKDCVLEGGMTKEDQKRKEIFFNEVLAKDEVDRLFDPKALVNWKRYTIKGEEKVKEFKRGKDGTILENLVIKGNNLLAQHSLKDQFTGKVKLIYIDPPYNREDDEATFYNDSFNHSAWLTFIKNRLEIAITFLKRDGVIVISIDDSEQAYLKVLCDSESIFRRENFLANIAYERSGVSGLGQGGSFLVNTHESILCYAKDKKAFIPNALSGESPFGYEVMKRYNKILQKVDQGKEISRFLAPSTGEDVILYKHDVFDVENISLKKFNEREDEITQQYIQNFESVFRLTSVQEENEFQNKILSICKDGLYSAKYLVSRGKNKGEWVTAYYMNGQIVVWLKDSSSLTDSKIVKTNKLSDFWDHASIPKADLANEGGVKLRRGKKPENLLYRIISMITKEKDLVMDFFSGSGTTCAVAHKMGRQYIGVEQLDYGENDSVVRLKNVVHGDQSGISKSVNWQGGGDFIYLELAKWNEEAKEKILKAKSLEELEKLFDELYERYFLNYNVKTKEFKEKILKEEEFKKLGLDGQKKLFVEMLDMNQMYVNFSERADKKYNLSKEDIVLSEVFYGYKK